MTDYMAQMLNELMGSQRDALPGERREVRYDDPNVCTDFLVAFCTHDIFRNTKNDLGFCKYTTHDESMKNSYQNSDKKGRMGFENRFFERIRRIHEDVRRKIQKHEDRLQVTQGDSKVAEETFEKKLAGIEDRKTVLTKKIEDLMVEAELEGEKGNVQAAQTAVDRADKAKMEREELNEEEEKLKSEKERAMNMEENVTAGNRQMQVCQICGCFMLQNDAPQRVDDHLTGKLHIAYQLIADTIKSMELEQEEKKKQRFEEAKERNAKRFEPKRRSRSRSRSRDRREHKEHHRDRERDRKEHREHKDHRHRDDRKDRKDRDRDRDRHRSEKERRRH
ncbi:unnamed protein product [Caenorhabditis sp. 36 PRJEB53466]|nr:unnamed protein product [Caenorhabditis sp. 36 PRJEB53466]